MPRVSTPAEDLRRCIWRENPVFVQVLGLCPTLAVTNTVANCIAMSAATCFVLICSSFMVSNIRKIVPNEVRIATFVVIIATFVTLADMTLEATVPTIHKALGAFLPLIVVNCIILGRQEAFASKNPVGRAVLDAVGNGIGFTIMLLLMGTIREVVGYGTFLGFKVIPGTYEPWIVMILPPGGFLTIGCILMVLNWQRARKAARQRLRDLPQDLVAERAA
jgi:electron transport complex protein RnfE